MRIISVINLKGGVGKTFTVAQMGHILNKLYGASVLLVDNDKQGNLSKYYEAYRENQQCGIAKLLYGDKNVNDMSNSGIKQVTSAYSYPLMDIIDANMTLLQATSDLHKGSDDVYQRYYPLRDAVAEDGKNYDFVIIDNPPDLDLNVVNALAVTDDVILVTSIDGFALPGLDIVKEQIKNIRQINPNINLIGTLVTKYKNNDANVSGLEWLRANGYKIFDNVIRFSEKVAENTFMQQPLLEYSPRSAAAVSYKKFVNEYVEKTGFQGGKH